MGIHNFDEYVERRGTGSMKWDGCNAKFGVPDDVALLPMWVADMDFKAPRPIVDAMRRRAEHGIYGYTTKSDEFYDSIVSWVRRRYHWEIEREWVVFSPAVVPALNIAIQAFTEPGDGVLVQRPVYYNFTDGIVNNGRVIVNNELLPGDARYEIDFDDLEEKASAPGTKLMILCSPHNPVGRVWTPEELRRIGETCVRHDIVLVSDEIHADIIMRGHRHCSTATLSPEIASRTIANFAPSKTFNLAGMQTAYNVIPDAGLRRAFEERLTANRTFSVNAFGGYALMAAYNESEYFVQEMCDYVEGNVDLLERCLRERLPKISIYRPEGTYLVWVDFRRTGLSGAEIRERMLYRARVAPDFGDWFGEASDRFVRLNLACPRSLVERAIGGLTDAFGDV